MTLGYTRGGMAEPTKAFTETIRNTAMGFTLGLTLRNSLDGGPMESNMDLESLYLKKANEKWGCGKMERKLDG